MYKFKQMSYINLRRKQKNVEQQEKKTRERANSEFVGG